jgi:hypothetical protein
VKPSTGTAANVELVERVARVTEAEGPLGLLEIFEEVFHPEWEWRPGIVGLSRLSYNGRDEFREYLQQVEATSSRVELTDWEVVPAGEVHVLLTGNLRFDSRAERDLSFDAEYAVIYRVQDGLLRSGRSFQSKAEASEAAMALTDA